MLEIPTIFDIKARVSTIYITAVNLALFVRSKIRLIYYRKTVISIPQNAQSRSKYVATPLPPMMAQTVAKVVAHNNFVACCYSFVTFSISTQNQQ